jgi:hypothetical protein
MHRAGFVLVLLGQIFLSRALAQSDAQLEIGGGKIDIVFTSVPGEPLRPLVVHWVISSARAVTVYYEQFPVALVQIRIRFYEGRGVRSGHTFGEHGSLIAISVGRSSTVADFADDWMMTHEMVHLAFPSVAEEHHWIEEGSATYIEPIARARIGDLTPEKVWGDLVDGLPQGLPEPNDRGLDFTPTWGRTYWGGALFCLLADIEIRKRTGNHKGLEHALRAIVKEGGTIESEWPLSSALEVGDRATGVPVLRELYEKMRGSPTPVDLKSLWKELGVERRAGRIEFNDAAPLALIRKAITALAHPGPTGSEDSAH